MLSLQQAIRLTSVGSVIIGATLINIPQTTKAQAFAPVIQNPFSLTVTGNYSRPAFTDLDNDGDLDMMAGNGDGNFYYFQNIGTALAPDFAPPVTNPFSLINTSYRSAPSLPIWITTVI